MRAASTTSMVDARSSRMLVATAMLGLAIIGISFGAVHMPWLIAGAVLGACVLAIALTAPLALVAVVLMLGPVDLSFLTGGFKALFPELGGLDMNGIRLLGATAGFVAYSMFEPRARAAAVGPLGRFWIVFLVYAGATVVTSMDAIEGLRLLLKLAYPFVTFLIVIGVADTRERLQMLMRYTLVAAAVYAILINPILAFQGGYRVDADGFMRIGGLGSGDNPFAFYLTVILLVAFTRFMLRGRAWYLLFCAILTIWIALTVTRIAVLAAMVGLTVTGLLGAFAARNRKVLLASGAAVLVVGVLLLPNAATRSLGFVPTVGEVWELLRHPGALYDSINWHGRQVLWAILWASFMAAPILGHGLGSSAVVIREAFPNQSILVAHNEYLRLGTDTGILGVALFGVAITSWLIAAVRLGARGDRTVQEYAFPAVAGIAMWAVIAATDNPIDYYTLFTQYIGFLVAGAFVAQTHADADAESVA